MEDMAFNLNDEFNLNEEEFIKTHVSRLSKFVIKVINFEINNLRQDSSYKHLSKDRHLNLMEHIVKNVGINLCLNLFKPFIKDALINKNVTEKALENLRWIINNDIPITLEEVIEGCKKELENDED